MKKIHAHKATNVKNCLLQSAIYKKFLLQSAKYIKLSALNRQTQKNVCYMAPNKESCLLQSAKYIFSLTLTSKTAAKAANSPSQLGCCHVRNDEPIVSTVGSNCCNRPANSYTDLANDETKYCGYNCIVEFN